MVRPSFVSEVSWASVRAGAGVQGALFGVERIVRAAPPAPGSQLDPASATVEGVVSEPDDMEGIPIAATTLGYSSTEAVLKPVNPSRRARRSG